MLSISLIKKFYESFISDQLVFLISVDEDRISGFVLGGDSYTITEIKKKFVRESFFRLFTYILFSPKIYPQILSRLKISKKQEPQKEQVPTTSFRLLSIGVDSEYKRSGIGSALIKGFEERAKRMGVRSYGLSVYKTNEKAISFYKKNDLKIEKETKNSLYFYKTLT